MLFLALTIILALLLRSWIGPGQAKSLSPVEAIQKINKQDAVMLDVRTDLEYEQGHILNAVHIPLGLLSTKISQLENHKKHPIIICCRVGSRSGQAIAMLRKQGFNELFQLRGGIMAWQSANLPLTTEHKTAKKKKKIKSEQNNATATDVDAGEPELERSESEVERSDVVTTDNKSSKS